MNTEPTTKNEINKDLHVFFDIIKSLIERELIPEFHLITKKEEHLKLKLKNKDYEYKNIFNDEFLFLNLSTLYLFYKRECVFTDTKSIPLEDLVNNIKTSHSYLGIYYKIRRIEGEIKGTCQYVFNYSAMKKQGFEL